MQEDSTLRSLVQEYGAKKWSHIAEFLPGRKGKQCRERWHNQLDPEIKKGPFSQAEDAIIVTLQAKIGNRWVRTLFIVVACSF